jgi:4'-phosphopantetheinyl transferase
MFMEDAVSVHGGSVLVRTISTLESATIWDSGFFSRMFTTVKVEVRDCCQRPGKNCVVPDLPHDVVHVWTRPLQVPPPVEQACYELLSAEERERAARYRVARPRNEFILTRGTLRSLLASYLGTAPQALSFRCSEHGKPFLDGSFDLRFNVSHTDGLALIAFVRTREIGVDVEKITAAPDAAKLAERFFSVPERGSLENLSGDELHAAFFRCWTRKESYVKARGEGLSLPLHQFDVSVAADEPQALLITGPDACEAGRWIVRDLPTIPGYVAALAVAEDTLRK